MKFELRIRKLETIMRDRLAAAAAAASVSIEQAPPLTYKQARRLDPHTLLQLVRAELRPTALRENPDYNRHLARFRRMSLAELWRLYPALKKRQMERQAQRRKACHVPRAASQVVLRNRGRDLAAQTKRAVKRDAPAEQQHLVSETNEEIRPPVREPWRFAWSM